jgi:hypothetical protein
MDYRPPITGKICTGRGTARQHPSHHHAARIVRAMGHSVEPGCDKFGAISDIPRETSTDSF